MWEDPIVEEVRKARDAHAAQFNYDLPAIYRALKEETESGHTFVKLPPNVSRRDKKLSQTSEA